MAIIFDHRDESEQIYTAKFLSSANRHGIAIRYETDRAVLDLGLHLTAPLDPRSKSVTGSRVWFQLKGKEDGPNGLTKQQFDQKVAMPQAVKIEHLRQWFRYAEPVYLTVYVAAVDKFFAIDINRVIEDRWGDSVFRDETFIEGDGSRQESITIQIPKSCEVNDDFWNRLSVHRSMRIDGASYQGQPLGHSHDPQSRIPRIMPADLFEDVIGSLLMAHRYQPECSADGYAIYPDGRSAGDKVSLSIGKLYDPYQYDLYLTREVGMDEHGYREDGQTFKIQGPCAVIIHSLVRTKPSRAMLGTLGKELAAKGIKSVLVFVNHFMTSVGAVDGAEAYNCFPEYAGVFKDLGIHCVPQHLEDLGKNISLATNVYMTFRERISWLDEVLERKVKAGELKIVTPEEYYSQ
jgi:hypothetical protein